MDLEDFKEAVEAIRLSSQITTAEGEQAEFEDETAMEHQGIDPRRLLLWNMSKKHQEFHDKVLANKNLLWTRDVEYNFEGKISQETFSNDWELVKDVRFFILMLLTRGSSFDKISMTSAEVTRIFMGHLKEKYAMFTGTRRPDVPLPPGVITISRIAAAFPTVTGDLFHMGYGKPLVGLAEIIGPDVEWPIVMCCPYVGTCMVEPFPAIQLLAVSVAKDDVIHPFNVKTPLRRLKKYLDADLNSDLIVEGFKLMKLKEWGVYDEGSYKPSISNSEGACREFIRKRRANDPDLDDILGF